MWQAYEIPASIEEALQILARFKGQARILAGGTDLIIQLRECTCTAECLVDVTRIPNLDRIQRDGEWIVLGCNVTFRQIKESPLLQEEARVLAEAAATVGALQIQSVATLAGNIVNAMPAADGSVALLALDGQVQIADVGGQAWHGLDELFLGPGQSSVDPTRQMVTAIRFPALGKRQGSAWERIGRRRALVLPILNCGVCVGLDEDGRQLDWARISLGPVAPVPFRARDAEAFLSGRGANEETFVEAAEVAAGESNPRSSLLRASREYRIEVLKVLVRQGLARATRQAQDRAA